jgi:hypothetical protein
LFLRNLNEAKQFVSKAWLERVIIYGHTTKPKSIKVEYEESNQSENLQFTYDEENKIVLIRKPDVLMHVNWSMIID